MTRFICYFHVFNFPSLSLSVVLISSFIFPVAVIVISFEEYHATCCTMACGRMELVGHYGTHKTQSYDTLVCYTTLYTYMHNIQTNLPSPFLRPKFCVALSLLLKCQHCCQPYLLQYSSLKLWFMPYEAEFHRGFTSIVSAVDLI